MKRVWDIFSTILVWILVLLAVCALALTILTPRTPEGDRELFGHRFYIVLSDSMTASGIHAGDLVIAKTVDPATLEAGEIISFFSRNPATYGQTVTHKIYARVADSQGDPAFITYGTATGVCDDTLVAYQDVRGVYRTHLPKVGSFFSYLKTREGYFFCVMLPFMLVIFCQLFVCLRAFEAYREAKKASAEQGSVEIAKADTQEGNPEEISCQEVIT